MFESGVVYMFLQASRFFSSFNKELNQWQMAYIITGPFMDLTPMVSVLQTAYLAVLVRYEIENANLVLKHTWSSANVPNHCNLAGLLTPLDVR